mgnify:CR=1 FL=1
MQKCKSSVIMVFYDLPVVTKEDQRKYRRFNDMLEKEGYIMFQKSVYVKLIHNSESRRNAIEKIKSIAPEKGRINALILSLAEFRNIINISGDEFEHDIFSAPIVFI